MKVAVFSAKPSDEEFLKEFNQPFGHALIFIENKLQTDTAAFAEGAAAVCMFVNDVLDALTLQSLAKVAQSSLPCVTRATTTWILRLPGAQFPGARGVPAYSPYAVAEHAVALLLALNRRVHKAYNRVREGNFFIDGLMGTMCLARPSASSAPASSGAFSRAS